MSIVKFTVHISSTVLQSFSNIFSLLQSVKARDEGKGEAVGKPPQQEEPRHPRNPPAPTHGYSRYDQERFRGKEGERLSLC